MAKHFGSRYLWRDDPGWDVVLHGLACVHRMRNLDTYPEPEQDVQIQNYLLEHGQSSGGEGVERGCE